jgi:hypothetical protein
MLGFPLDYRHKGSGKRLMSPDHPIPRPVAEAAQAACLEALYDLLEAAVDRAASFAGPCGPMVIGDLCRDASALADALDVLRRRQRARNEEE